MTQFRILVRIKVKRKSQHNKITDMNSWTTLLLLHWQDGIILTFATEKAKLNFERDCSTIIQFGKSEPW